MSESRGTQRRQLPLWQETILLVVTAVVMAIVVKAFFLQAFYIPSESMEPTLLPDDKILVQKVTLWAGDVRRGDIVVFDDPGGWLDPGATPRASNPVQKVLESVGLFPTGGHLVKRVVAVGGDTVSCCDDQGRLVVDGAGLDEPYVLDPAVTADAPFAEQTVPEGHLFVMGDNRGNSRDSRAHLEDEDGGFIAESSVVGKAWLRVWPLGRAGFIDDTEAFDDVRAAASSWRRAALEAAR